MKYNNKPTIIITALLPLLMYCATTKATYPTKQKDYHQEAISNLILKYKDDIFNNYSNPNTIRAAYWDINGYFTKVTFLDSLRNIPDIRYLCIESKWSNPKINVKELYKREVKFQEGNETYWIPMQESLISELLNTPNQKTIIIYYRFAGLVNDANNHAEPVFMITAWQEL